MLKMRQKLILDDLEKTRTLITGQMLADKYGVSLRTIRNDIDEISYYVKEKNGTFIKVQGSGMRVIAAEPLIESSISVLNMKDFMDYESTQKCLLLILCFLFSTNPITSDYLCDKFQISKGTLLKVIQDTNENLTHDLKIEGIKNKGYILKTKNDADKTHLLKRLFRQTNPAVLKNTIFLKENALLDENEISLVESIVNYAKNNMLLVINGQLQFESGIALILKMLTDRKSNNVIYRSIGTFVNFIEYQTKKIMDEDCQEALQALLSLYTDYSLNDPDESEKIRLAVSDLIQEMIKIYPELINQKEELQIDLEIHLKSSFFSKEFNNEKNTLLNYIKLQYMTVFTNVKQSLKVFKKYFDIKFSDDEVGYITLYFCKSLDKIEQIKEARVMVVCNTGRGASKFLATRIMNNCPEVHIVSMVSYFDINENSKLLDNIDLVISTIDLPKINVPYVIVSPLLSNSELLKIREACRLGGGKHEILENNNLNETVDTLVNKYVGYHDAKEFSDKLTNLFRTVENDHLASIEDVITERYTLVSLEVFRLFESLYPKRLNNTQYCVLSALMTHILMSIPRWERVILSLFQVISH